MAPPMRLLRSPLEDLIGNTPLLPLHQFSPSPRVKLFAKAEWFNPGGSVKDRPALRIVRDAERSGKLRSGTTLVDATSGNTGIAYAMLGAAKGFRVRLCLPASASSERKRILAAYGAELILTDPLEGSDGAIRAVRRLVAKKGSKLYYADQYNNPSNPRAHYETTAPEIWADTKGKITHLVAGIGTSGTFMGTAKRLRRWNPRIQCHAVQPDAPLHGLEGLKHMPSAIRPGIYDPRSPDAIHEVATEEAQQWTRRLAREAGLLVGVSSGAALAGALRVAATLRSGVVVTVFPDGGDKYLSERFWEASN